MMVRAVMKEWRWAAMVLLPLWLLGCKTSPQPKAHPTMPPKMQLTEQEKTQQKLQQKMERRVEHAVMVLEKRGDADSLAAAALLRSVQHRDQALPLAVRASAAAPERADLLWLRVQVCNATPYCDGQSLEPELRRLDPSNGIGWMGELARAVSVIDEPAQDAALKALGRAQYFDVYWTTVVGRTSAAARGTGLSPGEAMLNMTGAFSAFAFPPLSPAGSSCKGDRLRRAEVLEACRGVARMFENGDTDLVEMVGAGIAGRVWPEGSTEWAAAVRRRQVFDHREALWRALSTQMVSNKAWVERYVASCVANRREQDVVRAQLLDAGKNPEPEIK